ncbi:MAG: c-type cytochrome [Proteobacteria bacterium]|nr:c-type cytochrome [Pseudomonadota bacterium]
MIADAAHAQGTAPDTMAARVQGCSTCHGKSGEGTPDQYFPRIAGKPAGYLFNQLRNFRDGQRSYPPMNYLLAYLHDDYLDEMAGFFAAQRIPFHAPEPGKLPPAQLQAGEQLVTRGDPARGIPPCEACHGPQLTGIEPGIPGLIGLHSRYISAQLEAWRAGTRRANAPDCMRDIAVRLTEAQITQVAAWLASRPAPAVPVPAAKGSWKTPLVCGSQPQ